MAIGFNRDPHEKEDKLKSSELTTKKLVGRCIMAVSALVITVGSYEYIVSNYEPTKEVKTSQYISKVESGDMSVNLYGDNLIVELNKDLEGTLLREVYGGRISFIDNSTLLMSVNLTDAVHKFEIPKDKLLDDLFSMKYELRPYLDRFNKLIWDGKGRNLHIKVVDEKGNQIMEVGN